MKFLKMKKSIVALAAVAVVAIAAIGAYAYWTASGSGNGTAATGTISTGITVNQTSTIAGLYPGGPAQTLSGDFSNSNSSAAYVTSVTASLASVDPGPVTVDAGHPVCTTADFDLQNATTAVGQDIASSTLLAPSSGSWSGPTVALKDTAANQDSCKGATLHINYTSN